MTKTEAMMRMSRKEIGLMSLVKGTTKENQEKSTNQGASRKTAVQKESQTSEKVMYRLIQNNPRKKNQ